MDDLAHELPRNNLKRKADTDDLAHPDNKPHNDPPHPDPIRVDTSVASHLSTNAPRQPCIATDSASPIWATPSSSPTSASLSPQAFEPFQPNKRPRTEKHSPPSSPIGKRAKKASPKPRPPPTFRHGSDLEDIGIVSNADPGPSTGSLLHLREDANNPSPDDSVPASIPIDLNSTHIPPLSPLINRQTLKELDLETILRNPQLRHDLLFDPGLQFRPTLSRRKREMADKYWTAILQELETETHCTCVSFDMEGHPQPMHCACSTLDLPETNPVLIYFPTVKIVTLRMPSRIRTLLNEFLEVLLLVIQPLSSISGMYVNPNTFKTHMQEHSAQAAHIRQVFDPALIEQELKHNVFDPSGLFTSIGQTLKGHCAPMRDRAVEVMVQAAQDCGPGGKGTKADAIRAVRMCMEILELMKLDIANHQLHRLRPFLIRTSGQFELKTFKNRKGSDCSIRIARDWLCAAHKNMLSRSQTITHPLYLSEPLDYPKLCRNQQAYLAALKGFVDLVFDPPSGASHPLPPPPSLAQTSLPIISPLPGYPETSYLDSARLIVLGTDAADATALYMYLLLYRQLIYTDSDTPADSRKVDHESLLKLKNEIRDIGSSRLGFCFSRRFNPDGGRSERKDVERWRNVNRDVVLQVTMRAKQTRSSKASPPLSSSTSIPGTSIEPPDDHLLSLAQRWADSNIRAGSALSSMLRDRLRDVVLNTVISLAFPGRDSTTGKLLSIDFTSFERLSTCPAEERVTWAGCSTGMEPLAEEIRCLSEKISRLALIHLNAFLPLYEQDGFWES
ncbi:hypothetical protein BDN72DRAFT_946910 [Pluteus cervinus]|uniref:Uncharacterized protein n=1 Tax=Pluteus cervinus TaxID=181527 RepID=A0ACD3BAC5_9AGAR|nr:hypothetical protein BDN72DRAFT_946910 [Pluteus cervinus]